MQIDRPPTFDLFDQKRSSDRLKLVLPQPPDIPTNTANLYLAPLFFKDKWNGYRYWGIFAPYPGSNAAYENPCLVVSDDGWTWTVPAGVTNPIFPKPATGNNNDPSLVVSPDWTKLYLIWNSQNLPGNLTEIRISESTDGINWSAYQTIFSANQSTTNDMATPCVWFNGTNWKCIVHNHSTAGGIAVTQVATTSGADIYTGWGSFSTINMTHPAGLGWWHSHFQRIADGRIIGVVQDGGISGGDLWFTESLDDGANFYVRQIYSNLLIKYYRSAACITQDYTGAFGMELYVGTVSGGFTMCKEVWTPGLETKNRKLAVLALAIGSADHQFVFLDNFNRANGPVGNPVVGTAMTVTNGSFVIASNQLSSNSAGNNKALGTAPSPDYAIQATPISGAGESWLIFRAVDANNYWRWGYGSGVGGSNLLQSVVAGSVVINRSVTSPLGVTPKMLGGSIMKAVCRGGRVKLYINEEFCEEFADTNFATTGVKFGIQAANAGGVWDDLSVVAC